MEVLTKDIFPSSEKEGWGELKVQIELYPSCNFHSIGNCGLTVLQNVMCGVRHPAKLYPDKVVPEQYRANYISPTWGDILETWRVPYAKFMNSFIEDHQDAAFDATVNHVLKTAGEYYCFILSDGVNKHNKVRLGTENPKTVTTNWFGRKLVEKKYGYVVQSPLSVNAVHCTPNDFGYIRTWIWYPPKALVYKPDKWIGYGKYLTREEMIEKVQNHRNFKESKLSKDQIGTDYVDSYKI